MVLGPVMHAQRAPAPRVSALNSFSTGVLTSDELVRATESLYDDEIRPLSRILKRRLVELSGDANLRTMDIDLGALRVAVASAAPHLISKSAEGGDWEAVLVHRTPSFVDVRNPYDEYGSWMWQAFESYIGSLQDQGPERLWLPSSRYACALELQNRNLNFFSGLSLGCLCHIVQLSISQKKILGHRDGFLVPYRMSKCFEKQMHAELGVACAVPMNSEASGLPFADWASVRMHLADIMNLAWHSKQGCEPLANIKRLFRSRYHLELSETLLGYTKLSEVLQAPQVWDLCTLEMRNSGCCVIPTPPVPHQGSAPYNYHNANAANTENPYHNANAANTENPYPFTGHGTNHSSTGSRVHNYNHSTDHNYPDLFDGQRMVWAPEPEDAPRSRNVYMAPEPEDASRSRDVYSKKPVRRYILEL